MPIIIRVVVPQVDTLCQSLRGVYLFFVVNNL